MQTLFLGIDGVDEELEVLTRAQERERETHVEKQQPNLREVEILRLIAQGLTNREIGSQLHLSENTVKGYVKDVMAKLEVHNRIEAVLLAKERGLI